MFKEDNHKEMNKLKNDLKLMTSQYHTLEKEHDLLTNSHNKVSGDLSATVKKIKKNLYAV